MEQLEYTLQVGETMKALTEYGNQVLSAPTDPALPPFRPGDWVYLKTWKINNPRDQVTPEWNKAHLVILTTHSALKLQGITPWVHHSRVKRAPERTPLITCVNLSLI